MNKPRAVLITGTSGFIGGGVAKYFLQKGWRVVGVDRAPFSPNKSIIHHSLDLVTKEVAPLLKDLQPELLVHCAGKANIVSSVANPDVDFETNTALTFQLLEQLRKTAPRCKFIYLSSAAVYGNLKELPIKESSPTRPVSPYGFHKLLSEKICEEFSTIYQVPTASLRIFSAYGEGLRRQVIWDICQKTHANQPIMLQGTGKESRDFIHLEDIAKAIYQVATQSPMKGEVYNLASGHETTIAYLVQLILDSLGIKREIVFSHILPPGVPCNWEADITRLKNLGFTPEITLEEGIRRFVKWYEQQTICV